MKRISFSVLILLTMISFCACGLKYPHTQEETENMKVEIEQIKKHTSEENQSISVATNIDDQGNFVDYVEVSVLDTFIEKGKISKASVDLLENVKGAFIDDNGNLLNGYSFVGVKLNIVSDKQLEINTASFILRGIKEEEYFDAGCFYQDGTRKSDDIHKSGVAEVQKGTTELTVGFFVDEDMMKCEKFIFIPTVIETEDSQNNYIELNLSEELKS